MSEQANTALVQRLYDEVINGGNLEAADDFMSADFVEHEFMPIPALGLDAFKHFFRSLRTGFSDYRVAIEDVIAGGDRVVARVTLHGTQQGEFMGIPPHGKQVAVGTIDIFRLSDGKIAEHWGAPDRLGLMQQLGAMPAAR
jgi:steroid delta-isomerase-like uncharacterized protein